MEKSKHEPEPQGRYPHPIYNLRFIAAIGGFVFGLLLSKDMGPFTLIFASFCAVAAAAATVFMLADSYPPPTNLREPKFEEEDLGPTPERATAEFKYEVAHIIHKMTGKKTIVIEDSGATGVDIKVYDTNHGLLGIVQCQSLDPKEIIYPLLVRDLNTIRESYQVKTAYLVSTGRFSDESETLAQELGIRLIDGLELDKLRELAV